MDEKETQSGKEEEVNYVQGTKEATTPTTGKVDRYPTVNLSSPMP